MSMNQDIHLQKIQKILLWVLGLTALIVTPWMNYEPTSLVKYVILVSLTCMALGIAIKLRSTSIIKWKHSIPSILFLIALLIVFFRNPDEPNQLHGSLGRNFGLLTHLALLVLGYMSGFVCNKIFRQKVLYLILTVGGVNILYGTLQGIGFDLFRWSYNYSAIFGTLGNPNFFSAYLGIASAIAFAAILTLEISARVKSLLLLYIISAQASLVPANTVQGFYIFVFLASLLSVFRIVQSLSNRRLRILIATLTCLMISIVSLGTMGKGVLGDALYDGSVSYRGDYWRAGIRMGMENLFFGKGFDSYGDWYRYFRDEKAYERRGPDVVADSAHNIWIDYFVSGGILLTICYAILVMQVFLHALKNLKAMHGFQFTTVGPVVGFLGFQIQSVISVNQISISTLGWMLGGVIIGQGLKQNEINLKKYAKVQIDESISAKSLLFGVTFTALGILMTIAPLRQDLHFFHALNVGSKALLIESSSMYPSNSTYLSFASEILLANKEYVKSADLARQAVRNNPRNYYAWQALYKNVRISSEERDTARLSLIELDPLNTSFEFDSLESSQR